MKSYLAGTPLDVAYRQAGIELPPPGTPVTNPVDPGPLTAGAIGMFKDHYVVALSAAKALQDGQVVSLSVGGGRAGLPRLDRPVGAGRGGRTPPPARVTTGWAPGRAGLRGPPPAAWSRRCRCRRDDGLTELPRYTT